MMTSSYQPTEVNQIQDCLKLTENAQTLRRFDVSNHIDDAMIDVQITLLTAGHQSKSQEPYGRQ